MSAGYGVDSSGTIRAVWTRDAPGVHDAAMRDLTIKIPDGQAAVALWHMGWTWDATAGEAQLPSLPAEVSDAEVVASAIACLDQLDDWDLKLVPYGGTIQSQGHLFMVSARQRVKQVFQDASLSNKLKKKMLDNMALGAEDVNSPRSFAGVADAYTQEITQIVSWVDSNGERVPLANATWHGNLDPNFRDYDLSYLTA